MNGRLLFCDLGGTRAKYGYLDGSLSCSVYRTPKTFEVWLDQLASFADGRQQEGLCLGAPGLVAPDGSSWIRPDIFFAGPLSFADLSAKLSPFKLRLLASDCTASAVGLMPESSGVCITVSTGLGIRLVEEGVALLDPERENLMALSYLRNLEFRQGGESRSFLQWLGWREMQKWLPPELVGLSYRQLGCSGHPALLDCSAAYLQLLSLVLSMVPSHYPVWLAGGGSLALKHILSPFLREPSLDGCRFAPQAESIGIEGLLSLYQNPRKARFLRAS